jgi:ribonucleoside-diphosphate reductase alpha chain
MNHDYYEPQGLALDIFRKRYAITEHETFAEACDRVAYHVAQAEQGENIAKWRGQFSEALKRNLFFPGGRIMFGSGRPKGQLLNCFVIPTQDSREGWGKTTSDMIVISMTGGGVGTNYSPIRPRNSKVNGTGGEATGAVSLMRGINSFGEEIKGGGGRRVALMMTLRHDHGDIVEFLDAKLDLGKLNNANVSVNFEEDAEIFFEKVKKDEEYDLKHNGKIIGKISAKKIWHKIISNALKGGEPGILNGFYANKMNNGWYYAPLISTNPCGEIWLSAYDCCCLGSVVLPRFVDEETKEMNWEELRRVTALGVRFLDNVLSVNNYPLPEIKEQCSNLRRIGLGVTGLHDMLLKMGLKYNSPAGLEFVDRVMEKIKYAAYEASSDLAVEKGSFPKFDPELFTKSGFCKTLKPSLRERIRTKGMRNVAVLTVAPVGTGSMVCDTSSGIEPMFAPAFWRNWRDGDELRKDVVIHPLFARFMIDGKSVKHFQGAHDLKVRDHFEMQRVVQKHIDNAVSKTINVPHGIKEQELSDLYMEYFPELKGVTIYPDGSRENQPLTPMDLDEAIKYAEKHTDALIGAAGLDSCKDGKCDI